MNSTTIILVLLAVILTISTILYFVIQDKKELRKEISRLKDEIASAEINVKKMKKYIDTLTLNEKEKNKISENIKGAKTDEEIYSIITDIVHLNNKLSNK